MVWLPSLSALRAFEATARLDGFSAAARALNVTPAAVAQQVRALEADLGLRLVERSGRGLRLTRDGMRLAGDLSEGFRQIARAVEKARSSDAQPSLRIACPPAFSQSILMPRLSRFWQRHPDIALSLSPASQLTDLRRDGIDLAIRTGPAHATWPGHVVRHLVTTCYRLVAAPALLAEGLPLERLPWIGPFDSTDFQLLDSAGIDARRLTIVEFESTLLSRQASTQGYGLMFATDIVVQDDLRKGLLVEVPFPPSPGPSYWALTLPGDDRPALAAFTDWIRAELMALQEPGPPGCSPDDLPTG